MRSPVWATILVGMAISRFECSEFRGALGHVLAATHRGGAELAEVLATSDRIVDGDADSWLREWTATGGAAWAAARAADDAGCRDQAIGQYRRAATYYATALVFIASSSEPELHLAIWRRQRACWNRVTELLPVPGERFALACDGLSLPAYFFRASDAAPGERRPLLVINNGYELATSQTSLHGGFAASERGYHWLTFDGPGQQATRLENGHGVRPDWEAVLGRVVDTMASRPDVDGGRIAVLGLREGGYCVARALSFEHRFVAGVVDPGVVDLSTVLDDLLSAGMRTQLLAGNRIAFERELHLAELFSPSISALLRMRGAPYATDDSRFGLFKSLEAYRLGGEAAQISTPLLILESKAESLWPGQSRQLYDLLQSEKQLIELTPARGDSPDSYPAAAALRERLVFEWLDRYLA
jgi:hypothetical protein